MKKRHMRLRTGLRNTHARLSEIHTDSLLFGEYVAGRALSDGFFLPHVLFRYRIIPARIPWVAPDETTDSAPYTSANPESKD